MQTEIVTEGLDKFATAHAEHPNSEDRTLLRHYRIALMGIEHKLCPPVPTHLLERRCEELRQLVDDDTDRFVHPLEPLSNGEIEWFEEEVEFASTMDCTLYEDAVVALEHMRTVTFMHIDCVDATDLMFARWRLQQLETVLGVEAMTPVAFRILEETVSFHLKERVLDPDESEIARLEELLTRVQEARKALAAGAPVKNYLLW